MVSEADAKKWFFEYKLHKLDQSLLSPEVGRCLNDLLRKLLAEMSPEALVECEMKMGDPLEKWKLEEL